MDPQIMGISGSPVKDSNTDRLVKRIMAASGQWGQFVKLSSLRIQPCLACYGCAGDNICRVKDDFPPLAERLSRAKAMIIGCFPTFGSLNGFTKVFLERMYSLGHWGQIMRGKTAAVVVTGLGRGTVGLDQVADDLTSILERRGMHVVGTVKAIGNAPCLSCGHGEGCFHGALPRLYGEDLTVTPDKFRRIEDQPQVLEEADRVGRELAKINPECGR